MSHGKHLFGETYCNGMASVLSAKCSSCRMEIAFSTSQKVQGVGSGNHWECNVAAVWGQMSTGGGTLEGNHVNTGCPHTDEEGLRGN